MDELKQLIRSTPFRTFPIGVPPVLYEQRVKYETKYNPLSQIVSVPQMERAAEHAFTHPHAPHQHTAMTRPPQAPQAPQARRPREYLHDDIMGILVGLVDELSCLYPPEWMRDAKQQLKDKFVAFLVDANVVKALGRKKTVEAISFFEHRPRPDEARVKSLGWILSFLFDRLVYINEKKHTWNAKLGLTKDIKIIHHPNGRWSLKNDL
jgi:hypothetical protein